MKKFVALAAVLVAATFVSCNNKNQSEQTADSVDTTTVVVETPSSEAVEAAADTLANKADAASDSIAKAAEEVKDAVKK
ncbi:hypothetical protein [Porphyromonas pogonae]|uniref:hypothetical protein n=1 Tax=Porphyromonas pogonae TaxID=867595 RepID=UPI002E79DF6D|nr:hypothetical protein [Porphyromonas pogonae]